MQINNVNVAEMEGSDWWMQDGPLSMAFWGKIFMPYLCKLLYVSSCCKQRRARIKARDQLVFATHMAGKKKLNGYRIY